MNGGISRFGREHGVPTPLNEALTALVKGLERSWQSQTTEELRDAPRRRAREIERRWARIRAAAREAGVDAVLVCGSEYTGFEGAVRYVTGFRIVHRYAYVADPADESDPAIVFPREARWVGDTATTWSRIACSPTTGRVDRRARSRARLAAIAVYGLDYIMCVRDYRGAGRRRRRARGLRLRVRPARIVKSEEELESVRD